MTYFYSGAAKLPCRVDGYNQNGQLKAINYYHRDASGNTVSIDEQTPEGKPVGYVIRSYEKDRVEDDEYDIRGPLLQHITYFYGPSGRMTGRAIFPGGSSSTTEYLLQTSSEDDGLIRLTHQYRDGKLQFTMKYVFGPQGQMTHSDTYTADGYLAVSQEWDDGLVTDRTYHLRDGGTREFRYFIDNKRDPSSTNVFIDGKLLCTLKYKLEGADRATRAYGPDGKLWAYYPPPVVGDLERDGQPTGRSDGVIFRKGSWW